MTSGQEQRTANKVLRKEFECVVNSSATQQVSYERSSQAQSLTVPPILLIATGYLDSRRLAFQVCEERMLN